MLLYLAVLIIPLGLSMWAQWKVKSTFNTYSQVSTNRGLTGAEVARQILDNGGLSHVGVEESHGFLSDHYDPRSKTLRLSEDVYHGSSVAAAGVAAHEAGHALQDKQQYTPLQFRSAIVPAANIGSNLAPIIITVGFMLQIFVSSGFAWITWLGIILFAIVTLFTIVTLPVEFDASNRAKQLLTSQGIMYPSEMDGVNKTLNAAALTYVAAAVSAIANLLYYVYLMSLSDD